MNNIDRIKEMECRFDKAVTAVEQLDSALDNFRAVIPDIELLIDYYESELWMTDFNDDSEGRIPSELKRGVLSEDGIYNLLTDYQRLASMLTNQNPE